MDWSLVAVLALVGGFFLWRHQKNTERAKAATERLAKDNRLYQHIKAGMREYNWRKDQISRTQTNTGSMAFSLVNRANTLTAITAPTRPSKKRGGCCMMMIEHSVPEII